MSTYAGKDWSGRAKVPGREQTIGGYTSIMVPGLDDMTFFLIFCVWWFVFFEKSWSFCRHWYFSMVIFWWKPRPLSLELIF